MKNFSIEYLTSTSTPKDQGRITENLVKMNRSLDSSWSSSSSSSFSSPFSLSPVTASGVKDLYHPMNYLNQGASGVLSNSPSSSFQTSLGVVQKQVIKTDSLKIDNDKFGGTDVLDSVENSSKASRPELQMKDSSSKKPTHSYVALISMAILESEAKKMILADIYSYIMTKFPYYNNQDKAWKNSIRHNLSLNECFIKNGRAENGKGNYWSIHPACLEDFSKGDFRRRQARRRARRTLAPLIQNTQMSEGPVGYVPMTASALPTIHGIPSSVGLSMPIQTFPVHMTQMPMSTGFTVGSLGAQYFNYTNNLNHFMSYQTTPTSNQLLLW